MLEAVQIRDPERVLRRLSARALRRHGAAGDDRHDADPRAGPADRRRADLGARRRPCRPRCSASSTTWCASAGIGLILISHDLPARRALLRPGDRHVRGPVDGGAAGGGPRRGAAPLYARAARTACRRSAATAGRCRCSTATRPGRSAGDAAIEIDNLSVTFAQGRRQVRAVRDVSFSVAARESFGLVGESRLGQVDDPARDLRPGAGVWAGEIRIDGKAVAAARDGRAFVRQVQMVFQDPYGSLHPQAHVDATLASRWPSTACPARDAPGAAGPRRRRARPRASASATRTSSPAGSGSASRSPGR